jgi:hypothetical protein
VSRDAAPQGGEDERGIYQLPGLRADWRFQGRMRGGAVAFEITFASEHFSLSRIHTLVDELKGWLDAVDPPRPQLELVRGPHDA